MDPNAYTEMAETESRHWWFVARRKIISAQIASFGLGPEARIFEVGCGTGGNLRMLKAFGSVSAMEMNADAISIARSKADNSVEIRQGFCPENIPFGGEKFDLICMFDVLEHVEQDEETLEVLRGFLAPGGRLLLTVPAYQWLWGAHDQFLHHKRRYSRKELVSKIRQAGLELERVSFFNTLLFPLAALVRIKERFWNGGAAHGKDIPVPFVNSLLEAVFSFERHLLSWVNFPFGVSLMTVARRG